MADEVIVERTKSEEATAALNEALDKALAAEVVARAELGAIRLHSFRGSHNILPDLSVDGFEIGVSAEVRIKTKTDPLPLLFVLMTFKINAKAAGENKTGGVALEVAYELLYRLTSLDNLTQLHFNAYAQWICIYNAFPYLRQFVQDTTGQMGLPPIVLPLWKPKTDRPTTIGPSQELAFIVSDKFETAAQN